MAPDAPPPVQEPFPISLISGRYLLFDPPTVAHARRAHNITGVLIGTIPNLSQQNVFLGIPLELTPEEARVLVENGNAYVVDDAAVHREGFLNMSREDRLAFLRDLDERGAEISRAVVQRANERSEKALKEKGLDASKAKGKAKSKAKKPAADAEADVDAAAVVPDADADSSLFSTEAAAPSAPASSKPLDPTYITPTTSYPPLSPPSQTSPKHLPPVPRSYPLFRYLHSQGYFTMPGLRFGCHYSVYPGDPLRFHSHFLATGLGWDDEFELLDVVGGGRLGTGVKKAYLLGGEEKEGEVRAFSVEWAGL